MFIKNDREILNKSALFRLKLSFPNVSGVALHQWNYQFVETAANERTNAQLSEKYKPLLKCSKRFIPPQTDGMICFYSNIGCSESKVIFK